jgi:hypothetical protein
MDRGPTITPDVEADDEATDRYFPRVGGSFSIANPEDGTAIKEVFTYSDFLVILTEKCAYKIQMADQVDPKRLNPSLPKVIQQKLFDYGTESEIAGRSLLTAKRLFRKAFLPASVDLERGLKLSFEALSEIAAMKTAALEFKELEDRAMSQAKESRLQRRIACAPGNRSR